MVKSASEVLDTTSGLTNNGGPTQTIADQDPAVDVIRSREACVYPNLKVNPCDNPLVVRSVASGLLSCDQRGMHRPDPGDSPVVCDVGAFERQDITPFARYEVRNAEFTLPSEFARRSAYL